jgi:hypothetical protein
MPCGHEKSGHGRSEIDGYLIAPDFRPGQCWRRATPAAGHRCPPGRAAVGRARAAGACGRRRGLCGRRPGASAGPGSAGVRTSRTSRTSRASGAGAGWTGARYWWPAATRAAYTSVSRRAAPRRSRRPVCAGRIGLSLPRAAGGRTGGVAACGSGLEDGWSGPVHGCCGGRPENCRLPVTWRPARACAVCGPGRGRGGPPACRRVRLDRQSGGNAFLPRATVRS